MTLEELEAEVVTLRRQVQILAHRARGRAAPRDAAGQERGALYWPADLPVPVDPE